MQDDQQGTRLAPVPIFGSVLHTLDQTVAGRPYTLSVWLPPRYDETTEPYPVVYVLDGNTLFGLAASTTLALGLYHEIPDVVVVGLGVPMRSYDDDWGAHRDRDFTPTVDPDVSDHTGEASRFLAVLETDVIPFIDAHYRTTAHDRTLFGYSLGGLFVAYAYLEAPGLFHRYVAASATLDFDHRWVFARARATPTATLTRPAHLVLSAGEYEAKFRESNEAFAQLLRQQTADRVKLSVFVFDGETHASGVARAFVHGLKAAFAG